MKLLVASGRLGLLASLAALVVLAGCAKVNEDWPIRLEVKETPLGQTGVPGTLREHVQVSPDGRHLAWFRRGTLYLDGQPLGRFDGAGPSLQFSPDGRHLAAMVYLKRERAIAIDGVAGKAYEGIEHLYRRDGSGVVYGTFSPDGREFHYTARAGGKRIGVVVDLATGRHTETGEILTPAEARPLGGPELPAKEDPPPGFQHNPEHGRLVGHFTYSPDRTRCAYWVQRGRNYHCVVNGAIGPPSIFCTAVAFSPDGRRVAYIAAQKGTGCVVVDDQPGRQYAWLSNSKVPVFSPDGRHVAYLARTSADANRPLAVVVVDGVESPVYDRDTIAYGGKVVFDGPNRLYTIMIRGDQAVLLEVAIVHDRRAGRSP